MAAHQRNRTCGSRGRLLLVFVLLLCVAQTTVDGGEGCTITPCQTCGGQRCVCNPCIPLGCTATSWCICRAKNCPNGPDAPIKILCEHASACSGVNACPCGDTTGCPANTTCGSCKGAGSTTYWCGGTAKECGTDGCGADDCEATCNNFCSKGSYAPNGPCGGYVNCDEEGCMAYDCACGAYCPQLPPPCGFGSWCECDGPDCYCGGYCEEPMCGWGYCENPEGPEDTRPLEDWWESP